MVGLRTLDAAIVALEYKSALPEHVNRTVDENGASSPAAYINLSNSFWTAKWARLRLARSAVFCSHTERPCLARSYPNWYPFTAGRDENSTVRLELTV